MEDCNSPEWAPIILQVALSYFISAIVQIVLILASQTFQLQTWKVIDVLTDAQYRRVYWETIDIILDSWYILLVLQCHLSPLRYSSIKISPVEAFLCLVLAAFHHGAPAQTFLVISTYIP